MRTATATVLEDAQGEPLSLKLWTRKAGKGDYQIAQLMQTFLEKLGIKVELTVLESATFSASLSLGPKDAKYDLALLSWTIPTADPDEPMMYMTHTKAWKPAGANRMFFSNPETDRLAELAHAEGRRDQAGRTMSGNGWRNCSSRRRSSICRRSNLTEAVADLRPWRQLPAGRHLRAHLRLDRQGREEEAGHLPLEHRVVRAHGLRRRPMLKPGCSVGSDPSKRSMSGIEPARELRPRQRTRRIESRARHDSTPSWLRMILSRLAFMDSPACCC